MPIWFNSSSVASGTVTSFMFTNANGFTGVVTNPGTTPNLTLSISDARITSALLTGYVLGTNTAVAATDSILTAFGNVQAQINAINLTANVYKIAYYEEVGSASGTISIPSGTTILLNQLPAGADALVSMVNVKPTGENPKTAGGAQVDVSTFDALGNYTLNGTPSAFPVAIIFWLSVPADEYDNLNIQNILEEEIGYAQQVRDTLLTDVVITNSALTENDNVLQGFGKLQGQVTNLGGTYFQQNGNSFGAAARLGTNDAFDLEIETNNILRATFDTLGNLTTTGSIKLPSDNGGGEGVIAIDSLTNLIYLAKYDEGTQTVILGDISQGAFTYITGRSDSSSILLDASATYKSSTHFFQDTGATNILVISTATTVVTNPFFLQTTTASRALVTSGSNQIISSATTATEIGFVSGVTSSIQTQLNSKFTGSGSGTANFSTRWSGATVLANGILQDDGTRLGLGAAPAVNQLFLIQSTTSADIPLTLSYTTTAGASTNLFITNTAPSSAQTGINMAMSGGTTGNTGILLGITGGAGAINLGLNVSCTGASVANGCFLANASGSGINVAFASSAGNWGINQLIPTSLFHGTTTDSLSSTTGFLWQNAGLSTIFSIANNGDTRILGHAAIGATSTISALTLVNIFETFTSGANKIFGGTTTLNSSTGSDQLYGYGLVTFTNATGTATPSTRGIDILHVVSGLTGTSYAANGFIGENIRLRSFTSATQGTLTDAIYLRLEQGNWSPTGIRPVTLIGVDINSLGSANLTATNTTIYGIQIANQGLSTAVNSAAIKISAQSGSTNNYGILSSANILIDSPSVGIGYTTGAGGTVTQATSKATGVTLNTICGNITMNAAALAANTTVSFTLTNSSIAAGDIVHLQHNSAGTGGSYMLNAQSAAGSAVINVRNITAGSLSEAIVLKFLVIKGVTA